MIKQLILFGIILYQRYFSPYKGVACAYRLVHGGSGCSGVGYRLIRRYGVFSGSHLLQRRLARCRYAYNWVNAQRGFCDVPCDAGCGDEPHLPDMGFEALDMCDACDACDACWNTKSERPKKQRKN